ncbi:signal transduction histidine hinase [Tolypothrix sp. NIES-4075]|uniref:chemotaxis protein CheB n=1 Tax=Tolypothrix sp. NIES-4075 TaxID=2005459 RepID=UPI000B5C9F0E|nr:chemotaxis protein CheB [Tolypothrix sp. NIES-4075]GAX42480.1 signal transduction histidine hinase [Tolypothrix sp. NIES-4075]
MTRRPSKKSQSDPNDGKAVNQEQQDNSNVFPIVGIGASAGGLEAFTELLTHLPSDTGMAFVLIQHLDPNHKSLLKEILSRATEMSVHEVVDNTTVEPNQLYVIPPNKQMVISQGVLKLMPREKIRGLAMTVDTFFLSLAEDQGNKAIAIVLSGGDGDGALGAKAIKAAGGITFAQCRDTAQVSSMPNTAAATGHVDFILPPQAIAQELVKISQHPYIADSASVNVIEQPEPIQAENALQAIFLLMRSATKVDFTYYKHTTLKRRIFRRMVLYQIERLEDYLIYLQNHPAEVQALYEDVLINVTSFMRDPEAFEALKSKVFPIITKDKSPGIPLRIWVAGCATGEEAYSIAICLLEFLETQLIKPPIQIYATDISESAIERARLGIYKASQMQDVSPERLRRFFIQLDDGYQISKSVRELCVFAKQNLGADPPFSKLDLISCRNVMIYFSAQLQKKILPIFHYGLKSTGFLMLGTSETVGESLDLFSLVDKKYKIYARKLTQARLPIDIITNNYPLNLGNFNPQNQETFTDFDLQKEADQIVLNRYAPVGVITNYDLEILQFRGQTSFYLQPAPGRASLNLLKMVREDLRLELRTAIGQARKQDLPVKKENLQISSSEQVRQVSINVIPFKARTSEERYFLILFEDAPATSELKETKSQKTTQRKQTIDKEIARLQQELAVNKEHLQATIEEQEASNQDLRAANEEILSSNEELQSTNEELETAKEEIQAANEELNTVNDELYRRNIESNQLSNDLQNLLSSTNIPIVMLGADLRIRRFTPFAEKILNLIPTDVGRPLGDINHNLNIPDLEQQILDVINTLSVKQQEVQDHNGHWYDLRIRPYRTIDNKIDGAVVILVDIDALKRSAEQLQQSRNYAEAIVETMREALLVLDSSFRVLSANRAFYETFQVSPEQVEQRLIFDLGNQQWDIPQLRSLLEAIAAGNSQLEDFQNLEVEHEFEKIGRKVMLLNARKMSQANHQDMILLAIDDITQEKQLQTERTQLLSQEQSARSAAEKANRIKDEFLSILSHELRNPLNSLIGWTQLLRKQKLDKNRLARGLEAIENSAKLQTQLIEDLLDISRVTSGKLRLNAHLMQLAPVIRTAIEVVRVSADARQIQLESRLNAASKQIFGDPIRIQQVVWNLLSNAIKFTPPQGRVEITLKYIDSMAQIQVSDTGKGISADFLPYVFDRFRQADSTLTRQNTGLGLGLTIVRNLVEAHGGTVHAESLGEGLGATFTVRLPLQSKIAEPAVNSPEIDMETPVGDIPSLAGVRVLVVDDAADVREIFTAVLEAYQATVTTVTSATDAIATLTANPSEYDVLLSDISMPGEDGYTFIRRVRQLSAEAGGQIPAAALTAHARSEDYAEAIAAGFQMHLTKPVPPDELVLAVATLAGRIRGN